jgi:hypothetical protein
MMENQSLVEPAFHTSPTGLEAHATAGAILPPLRGAYPQRRIVQIARNAKRPMSDARRDEYGASHLGRTGADVIRSLGDPTGFARIDHGSATLPSSLAHGWGPRQGRRRRWTVEQKQRIAAQSLDAWRDTGKASRPRRPRLAALRLAQMCW